MIDKIRETALALHQDERGVSIAEVVLLLGLAIAVLTFIATFVKWAIGELKTRSKGLNDGGNDIYGTGATN